MKTAQDQEHLELGDVLHRFRLPATGGKTVGGDEWVGKPLVLLIYLMDRAELCRKILADFRDLRDDFSRIGVQLAANLRIAEPGSSVLGAEDYVQDDLRQGLGHGIEAPLIATCAVEYRLGIYRRPDGRRVRMLVPHNHVPAAPRPIGWVVLLHRTRNAEPALRPIEPSETLSGLLNGAFSRNAKLTSTAFDALCRVIRSARGFRLTYAKLDDAVNLLKPVCR